MAKIDRQMRIVLIVFILFSHGEQSLIYLKMHGLHSSEFRVAKFNFRLHEDLIYDI